ncbi:MAG: sensor histidine kinase [Eubacterium sp.]|nr:sensor histidine kinase [Eubacterium sp.]
MKFSDYLRAHLLKIIAAVLVLGFLAFSLSLFALDTFSIFFLILVPTLTLTGFFLGDFFIRARFYNTLFKTLEELDQKSLLPELLPWPSFLEGQLLYDILKVLGKDMNDHIGDHKRNAQDYREFVESWVHEIKTPIASLRLTLENHPEIAALGLGDDLGQIEDYITQALFYARSGSVEKDYTIRSLSLDTVVNPVIRRNARSFIRQKIRLELTDLDCTVYSDGKWLEFIVAQLVGNALKYLDFSKDEPPKITISALKGHSEATLLISDNGVGIDPRDLPRVLYKGFTGKNGRLQNRNATGLGLYLAHKLCQHLGLTLTLSSEVGVGTTAKIVFPVFDEAIVTKM